MSRPNYNFPSSNLVLLDAGHGGLDAQGKYTTDPRNGKWFDHKDKSLNFHGIAGNSVFYEGVSNRFFARALSQQLMQLGVPVLPVYHDHLDTSLSNRAALANAYHKLHQRAILVSLHSNATQGAHGWEIHTTRGTTQADPLAKSIENHSAGVLQKYTLRNRGQKENNFTILATTNMPSVLIESLFFDNLREAKLLDMPAFVTELSAAYANGILAFLQDR
jgi:N-acetylmuramoyl-L-alanine amidase